MDRTQTSSPSLLSNVSFDPELEDEPLKPSEEQPKVSDSRTTAKEYNENVVSSPSGRLPCENRRSQGSHISSSYQKLLDRSSDLESPLKQFAQKHGYKLNEAKESPVADRTKSSPSPTDLSLSELTKVTPRTDSNLSPRQKSISISGVSAPYARSYTIDTAVDAKSAKAAGIPVIADNKANDMADSCSEITFNSITDDKDDIDSPVQPIVLTAVQNGTSASQQMQEEWQSNSLPHPATTSFIDMGKSKLELDNLSLDTSMISSASSLKQQYEQRQHTEGMLL